MIFVEIFFCDNEKTLSSKIETVIHLFTRSMQYEILFQFKRLGCVIHTRVNRGCSICPLNFLQLTITRNCFTVSLPQSSVSNPLQCIEEQIKIRENEKKKSGKKKFPSDRKSSISPARVRYNKCSNLFFYFTNGIGNLNRDSFFYLNAAFTICVRDIDFRKMKNIPSFSCSSRKDFFFLPFSQFHLYYYNVQFLFYVPQRTEKERLIFNRIKVNFTSLNRQKEIYPGRKEEKNNFEHINSIFTQSSILVKIAIF